MSEITTLSFVDSEKVSIEELINKLCKNLESMEEIERIRNREIRVLKKENKNIKEIIKYMESDNREQNSAEDKLSRRDLRRS